MKKEDGSSREVRPWARSDESIPTNKHKEKKKDKHMMSRNVGDTQGLQCERNAVEMSNNSALEFELTTQLIGLTF